MSIKLIIDKESLDELYALLDETGTTEMPLIAHPPREVVQLSAATYSASETDGFVVVTVDRVRPNDQDLAVNVITEDIDGLAGVHYVALQQIETIGIGAGETSATKAIQILNAGLGAGNSRTFRVRIEIADSREYKLGSRDVAVVTVNGAGGVSDGGVLQFDASSYNISETVGTDTVTVNVTRTGTTGTPPAASVTVTSTDNTAVAPTDYTAISGSESWGSGITTPQNVAVTVVNNPAAQGNRQFNLTLSAPSGAVLGSVSSCAVTIIDVGLPTGEWPRTAIYTIGSPQDYTSTAARRGIALSDVAILQYLKARGIAKYQTDLNAIIALGGTAQLYLYRNIAEEPPDLTNWPDMRDHIRAETGVPGLGQAPNDWLFQNAAGTQVHKFANLMPYINSNCVEDASGFTCAEYLAAYMANEIEAIGISSVGLFWDNFGPTMIDGGDCVRNADNINRDFEEQTMQTLWRGGLQQAMDRWRVRSSTRKCTGNTGPWIGKQINGAAKPAGTINSAFSALQMDGGMFEKPFGTSTSKFGQTISGATVVTNTNGSFTLGRDFCRHSGFSQSLFRNNPAHVVWAAAGMSQANLDGAGKTAGYRYSRYVMACCWVLSDHFLDLRAGYGDIRMEFDEYYGVAVPGTFSGKLAARHWMGAALEVSQGSPRSLGVYWREYANALVLLNPHGNGTQTITTPAGSWRRIAGAQDPAVNTGATVGATIQITDGNGLVLVRQ